MRATLLPALAGILAVMLLGPLAAAQNQPLAAAPPPEQTAAPAPPVPDQAAASYTPEQLDQLTAPIALYPDALVAQILMAATYPLEVVEADRWLQQPANAALKGEELAAALVQLRWDPSVKSLVAFPQILRMMDSNLTWTEQIGDAFLAEQPGVMDSVQRLRQKAAAAGRLQTTPQQSVSNDSGIIVIEPPETNIVYVPVYDPNVVYGAWPYPDYPPDSFPGSFPDVSVGPLGLGWLDVAIIVPLWRWHRCDWRRHRIEIDERRFSALNPHQPPTASGVWHHDPVHRAGVPYRDPAVRARFQSAVTAPAVRAARGFPAVTPALVAPRIERAEPVTAARPPIVVRSAPAVLRPAPVVLRPAPAVLPSFGRGPEVRADALRGQPGRMAAPPPRVAAPVPVPRVAPPVAKAAPAPQGGEGHR